MNIIGWISWEACENCQHYRPEMGGCDPLDTAGDDMLKIDYNSESIVCCAYKEREAQG
jgi:hypothetical protein